jgi:predicted flap endonuclease-1-like 5' DNA nuclease
MTGGSIDSRKGISERTAQMTSRQTEPMESLAEQGADMFRMWVSLWPVAPLFGVEWRFAELMQETNRLAMQQVSTAMSAAQGAAAMSAEAAGATPAAVEHAAAVQAAEEAKAFADMPAEVGIGTNPEAEESAPAEPAPDRNANPDATAGTAPAEIPLEEKAALAAAQGAEALESMERTLAELTEPARPGVPAAAPANLYDAPPGDADDLKRIKGIGPGLEQQLNDLGIYKVAQLARMSEGNLVWIDDNLTAFKGRAFRDDWVGQARSLLG